MGFLRPCQSTLEQPKRTKLQKVNEEFNDFWNRSKLLLKLSSLPSYWLSLVTLSFLTNPPLPFHQNVSFKERRRSPSFAPYQPGLLRYVRFWRWDKWHGKRKKGTPTSRVTFGGWMSKGVFSTLSLLLSFSFFLYLLPILSINDLRVMSGPFRRQELMRF